MEKTPKEIAGFLKSVIKAINERKKFVGAKLTEINNPNKTITEIFEQDEAIGKHAFQITLDRSGNEEYNKAADVIHVWG